MAPVTLTDAHNAARRALQTNGLTSGTAGGYRGMVTHFSDWMKENYPVLMDGPEREGFTFDWEAFVAPADGGHVSLSCGIFEAFVASIKRRRGDAAVPLSDRTMLGYRSALIKLCNKCGYCFPPDFAPYTRNVLATVARVYARAKKQGIVEDTSKVPLSFDQYYHLCRLLHQAGDIESKELLCFIQAQWNITCRAETIETLKLAHFKAFDDSLQVVLYVTKTKQKGEDLQPRYMYFNPIGVSPDRPGYDTRYIDFGLGLASYFMSQHDRRSNTNLFYKGAAKNLRKRLKKFLRANYEAIGIDKEDVDKINFHSLRKGAGTHATSGSIGGPSMVSIAIRMQHNVGVQGTYLQFEHAGDQFVGRVVAGFDLQSPTYDTLPPDFSLLPDDINDISKRVFGRATTEILRVGIIRRLLANVIYHAAWLKETLSEHDPLHQNHLFENPRTLRRLSPEVRLGGAGVMQATGIPPHIPIMRELRGQITALNEYKESLLTRMEELFDSKFAENAASSGSLSRGEVTQILRDAETRTIETIKSTMLAEFASNRSITTNQAPETPPDGLGPAPPGRWHVWPPTSDRPQGSWQRLPENYRLPCVGLKIGLKLWLRGNQAQNIGPLQSIGSGYRETVTAAFSLKKEETKFYEWQAVMIHLSNLAKSKWSTEMMNREFPRTPSEDDVLDMWDIIKEDTGIPSETPKGRVRNISSLSIMTASRLLKDMGKIKITKRTRQLSRVMTRRSTRLRTENTI